MEIEGRMAWGVQTDPDIQHELDWMCAFIDERLIPLEPRLKDLAVEEWVRHLEGSHAKHMRAESKDLAQQFSGPLTNMLLECAAGLVRGGTQ